MKPSCFLWGCALVLALGLGRVHAQYIYVNLSFKSILNPTNGLRYYPFTEANIDASIAKANEWLASYERGYRLRRVEPIQDIGGYHDYTGPSSFYGQEPNAASGILESNALANPTTYAWNSHAVNYYLMSGYDHGGMQTNTLGQPVGEHAGFTIAYLIELGTLDSPMVLLHETGHHFGLPHTHGNCYTKDGGHSGCIYTNGFWCGDDGFGDTLLDAEYHPPNDTPITLDDLAYINYRTTYAGCSRSQQVLLEDTFTNLMSYHATVPYYYFPPGQYPRTERLTEQQLDAWTDAAYTNRLAEVSGRTIFVQPTGNNANSGLISTAPKRDVLVAVNAASSGGNDIVLLRAGHYNEHITINKAVTLRATRVGPATIGQ